MAHNLSPESILVDMSGNFAVPKDKSKYTNI